MGHRVRTVLVGLGGYGQGYVGAALDSASSLGIELVGAVDPTPERCARVDEVRAAVARIYPTVEEYFAHADAELAVIASPIQYHAQQTIAVLEHGAHVLCEKPVAAVVQDALAMQAAERASGRTVTIGYQWSFSPPVRRLRDDIAAGRFGAPRLLKTLAFWPRTAAYYGRSSWAGALRTADGTWVLDSPMNNATAHFLHNCFFILGKSGRPTSVQAELYRANPIENCDTTMLRVATASGADVLFLSSHAVPSNVGPLIHYEFDDADVFCESPGEFRVRFADGRVEAYGSPEITHAQKLAMTAVAVSASGAAALPICGIGDALGQIVSVCGAHDSTPVVDAPAGLIRTTRMGDGPQGDLRWVEGLQAAMIQSYDQGVLPSESGSLSWAVAGRSVDLSDYREYKGE